MTDQSTASSPTIRPLDGKGALVVGASSGIGRATARALAQAGAHVALAARRHDRVKHALASGSSSFL